MAGVKNQFTRSTSVALKGHRVALLVLLLAPFFFFLLLSGCLHVKTAEKERLVISVFDSQGESAIWLVDAVSGRTERLVANREVMLSGKLAPGGKWLVYSDAVKNGPWDAFLLNLETKKVYQVTHDRLGEFNLRFGDPDGKMLYALVGGLASPVPKIAVIDVAKGKTWLIGPREPDRAVEAFDIANGRLVAVTYSYKEDEERMNRAGTSPEIMPSLKYEFFLMNGKGGHFQRIVEVKAEGIDSVTWSPQDDTVLFGGRGVVLDSKSVDGLFLLNIDKGTVSPLLTGVQLKKTGGMAESFSEPISGCLSADGGKLYLPGVPRGAKKSMFGEIAARPSAVFCYDLRKKKIAQVFEKPETFVTDLTATYQ
jgi:hypothetical protein